MDRFTAVLGSRRGSARVDVEEAPVIVGGDHRVEVCFELETGVMLRLRSRLPDGTRSKKPLTIDDDTWRIYPRRGTLWTCEAVRYGGQFEEQPLLGVDGEPLRLTVTGHPHDIYNLPGVGRIWSVRQT